MEMRKTKTTSIKYKSCRVTMGLYRLGNRRPDLENRKLLMDSVFRLENLCQYLGKLFSCVSPVLHTGLCGQSNIAGCGNVR